MTHIYKKLPLVVIPPPNGKLSKWISELAEINEIHFDYFIHYIHSFDDNSIDLTQVLSNLTLIPQEMIERLSNDINNFPWDLKNKCIIKNCKNKFGGYSRIHNIQYHKLGVKWISCILEECNYRTHHYSHLKLHLADKHNIGVQWYYCDECIFRTKRKHTIRTHKARLHTPSIILKDYDIRTSILNKVDTCSQLN